MSKLLFWLIIISVSLLLLSLLVVKFTLRILEFRKDLKYINTEIARTQGSERKYWKEERRKLWLFVFFSD